MELFTASEAAVETEEGSGHHFSWDSMEAEIVRWRNSKTQFGRMPNRGRKAAAPLTLAQFCRTEELRYQLEWRFWGEGGTQWNGRKGGELACPGRLSVARDNFWRLTSTEEIIEHEMHSTHFSAEITYRVKKPLFCHLINRFKYLDYTFCRRRILQLPGKSQNLPIKVLGTFLTIKWKGNKTKQNACSLVFSAHSWIKIAQFNSDGGWAEVLPQEHTQMVPGVWLTVCREGQARRTIRFGFNHRRHL